MLFLIVSAELNSRKTKPVSVSLIHPYSDTFVSKSRSIASIPDLFDKEYLEYHDLLEACSNVNIQITAEERKHIQEDNRTEINHNVLVSIVTELVKLGHQLVKQNLTPTRHGLH